MNSSGDFIQISPKFVAFIRILFSDFSKLSVNFWEIGGTTLITLVISKRLMTGIFDVNVFNDQRVPQKISRL